MPVKRDYYELLGISREASQEEIRTAFRKLAFQYHPDHNHQEGAAERFKEIVEAYQVLGNTNKRTTYDRFGYTDDERRFEGLRDFGTGLGDIFDAFFGSRIRVQRRTPQQGSDLRYELNISFEESVHGCRKQIEILRLENCSHCLGSGCEPGTQPAECPTCNGMGETRRVQRNVFGRFVNRLVCDECGGEGTFVDHPCAQCHGAGKQHRLRTISVKVPAGVQNRAQMKLLGEGEAGMRGGLPGDLHIAISVQEHELFKRDGNDIVHELSIDFAQAALGDDTDVPTLDGKVKLGIPPGTQTGTIFRIKGKGIPYSDHPGKGDQLVKVKVMTPEHLNADQRRLFVHLAESLGRSRTRRKNKEKSTQASGGKASNNVKM